MSGSFSLRFFRLMGRSVNVTTLARDMHPLYPRTQLMRTFERVLSLTILAAGAAFAMSHHALNGSWKLIPDRSDFGGAT
jgi:hypothetical protein